MKLAIPSMTDQALESSRSGHFGHSPFFTIVSIEDGKVAQVEVVKNVDHGTAGCGGVIDYVLSLGIDAILAVGMGMPPFTRFTNGGVKVYRETQTENVGDVVDLFLEGKVDLMDPGFACRH